MEWLFLKVGKTESGEVRMKFTYLSAPSSLPSTLLPGMVNRIDKRGVSPDWTGDPKCRGNPTEWKLAAWTAKGFIQSRRKVVEIYQTHHKGVVGKTGRDRLSATRQWVGTIFKGGR